MKKGIKKVEVKVLKPKKMISNFHPNENFFCANKQLNIGDTLCMAQCKDCKECNG